MTIRADRDLGERARFGLGTDTQDDAVGTELTEEDVVTDQSSSAADISADSTTLVGTGTTVQAVLEELDDTAALAAPKANFASVVIAGADNSVSHDYTATGVTATSKVFGAFALKDQATIVAAVAGTITPGTDKITVAGGADLSTFFLVFLVIK